MSSVIHKGFGDGHSQSPAKEMAQEKLIEVKMCSHLLTCFEKKQLTSFPNERRKAREEYLFFPTQEIELYYTCLMPETYGDSGVLYVNYYQNLIVVLVLYITIYYVLP